MDIENKIKIEEITDPEGNTRRIFYLDIDGIYPDQAENLLNRIKERLNNRNKDQVFQPVENSL